MNAFFFWAAWACGTERPGSAITYTQNWPPEPLIDNRPTGSIVVWSVVSFVVLLAGIGAMVWYFAVQRHKDGRGNRRRAAARSAAGAQGHALHEGGAEVFLGRGGAHRGAGRAGRGHRALRRGRRRLLRHSAEQMAALLGGAHLAHAAWHLLDRHRLAGDRLVRRAGRFGLRTAGQRLGVNFLFVCLLVIVVGSLAGEWLGVQQKLGFVTNFWFGHQGYEYVDLGRFWQIFLFVGPVPVAVPHGPRALAGAQESRPEPAPAGACSSSPRPPSACSTARA